MVLGFFFDSYAIVELIKANPDYDPYSQEPVTITLFNIAEIYWYALNRLDAKEVGTIYDRFKKCLVDVDDDTIKSGGSQPEFGEQDQLLGFTAGLGVNGWHGTLPDPRVVGVRANYRFGN